MTGSQPEQWMEEEEGVTGETLEEALTREVNQSGHDSSRFLANVVWKLLQTF